MQQVQEEKQLMWMEGRWSLDHAGVRVQGMSLMQGGASLHRDMPRDVQVTGKHACLLCCVEEGVQNVAGRKMSV